MTMRLPLQALALALVAAGCATTAPTGVTPPAPTTPPPASGMRADAPATDGPLAPLAWLAGCWRGSVNQREFREHWLPLRGDLLVGAGHIVNAGRTQDFEYVRVEPRADGVYYVALPSGQKPTAFKLASTTTDGPDTIFTFSNPSHEFPQTIIYRRATGGWLYVHVEGKVAGEERRVIYPFRRIDCESGDLIDR